MQGKVIKLLHSKGYGFIKAVDEEDLDDDIFFHHSAVEGMRLDNMEIGTIVEFDLEDTEKGPQATNVKALVEDESEEDEFEAGEVEEDEFEEQSFDDYQVDEDAFEEDTFEDERYEDKVFEDDIISGIDDDSNW